MKELESLLMLHKESVKAAKPVLSGVEATLPWAQALLAKEESPAADEAKKVFKKFDANKDGNLTVAETAAMAPTDADRFCNAAVAVMCADLDGAGSLSEAEFASTFKSSEFTQCYIQFEPHCHGHTSGIAMPKFLNVSSNLTAKFRQADSNKDGVLSVAEFTPLAKEMDPDVTNPACQAQVAVRCADEDGTNSVDLVEFIDVYSESGLLNDYQHCMTLNSPACNPNKTAGAVPKHLKVSYSKEVCTDLFAYKFERDLCANLQTKICGTNCAAQYNLTKDSNTTKRCGEMQELLCKVPTPLPAPKPLSHGGSVPNNTLNTTVTVCIAFANPSASPVWIAGEGYGFPKPLATKLSYLDCAQIHAFRGMDIGVYSGATKVAHHVAQERDEIVMVGESLKNAAETAVVSYSFKDDEMRRPILCHAAAKEPTMEVSVYSRNWHVFEDNMKNTLSYLQCEVLLMDHDDLVKQKESLQFSKGKTILGHIEVGPLPTLYLLRSGRGTDLRAKAHNLGHLKY